MTWDKANLNGKVTVNDITETARKYIPEMRAKGADVVVVVAHSGLSADPYQAMAENSVYYLSQVPGVDAIMFGHAHAVFPGKDFANIKGADIAKGTLNGVPAVMPGMWGDHLGVVDLVLNNDSGKWQVTQSKAEARPIYDAVAKKSLAAEDAKLVAVLKADHDATREFVSKPIGKSADNMYSYLALVQDDPTVQVVNMAQKAYVEHYIQGDPDLAKLPVLSAAAPFKVGGRKNDPASFVEVEKGQLTFRNAADLYLYPNTLVVMKVSGKEVKEWLECSAGQFNQIDPASSKPQSLINWDGFRTYNFDVIDGVNYQIDVTQPARYDGECQMIHPQAERIKHLTFNGKPVDPQATFLSRPITIALTAANSPAPVRAISPSPHRMKTVRCWRRGLARNRRRKARSIRRRITTGVWRRSTATRRWIFVLRPRLATKPRRLSKRKRSIQCARWPPMISASPFISWI